MPRFCQSCGWDTPPHAPGCSIRQREISEGKEQPPLEPIEDIPAMDGDRDWYATYGVTDSNTPDQDRKRAER